MATRNERAQNFVRASMGYSGDQTPFKPIDISNEPDAIGAGRVAVKHPGSDARPDHVAGNRRIRPRLSSWSALAACSDQKVTARRVIARVSRDGHAGDPLLGVGLNIELGTHRATPISAMYARTRRSESDEIVVSISDSVGASTRSENVSSYPVDGLGSVVMLSARGVWSFMGNREPPTRVSASDSNTKSIVYGTRVTKRRLRRRRTTHNTLSTHVRGVTDALLPGRGWYPRRGVAVQILHSGGFIVVLKACVRELA